MNKQFIKKGEKMEKKEKKVEKEKKLNTTEKTKKVATKTTRKTTKKAETKTTTKAKEKATKTKTTETKATKKTKTRKEEFDSILEKIREMSDAIELHTSVKKAVSKEEVDNTYLKYIENSLEDKLFDDVKFDKINSNILLEVICPDLVNIENFEIDKLEIADIGSHFEEEDNYIDKICTYDNNFICLFGVNEENNDKVIKYEQRKFSRLDIIEAISKKIEQGKTVQMEQYDEYYIIKDTNGTKVFSERKMTSLIKMEDTMFDKIKSKLTSLFKINLFTKKKSLPNVELIYDTNPNRFKNFKHSSKVDAKNRMKTLLTKERETIRNASN